MLTDRHSPMARSRSREFDDRQSPSGGGERRRRTERRRDRRRPQRRDLRGWRGLHGGRSRRPDRRRHPFPDHVDDQNADHRRGSAAEGDGQPRLRRPRRRLPSGVRGPAGAGGFRRRHATAAPAGQPSHRQAVSHPHRRSVLLVLERRHHALGGGNRHPQRPLGRQRRSSLRRWLPTRAPSSSTASTPTGWAESSRRPAA